MVLPQLPRKVCNASSNARRPDAGRLTFSCLAAFPAGCFRKPSDGPSPLSAWPDGMLWTWQTAPERMPINAALDEFFPTSLASIQILGQTRQVSLTPRLARHRAPSCMARHVDMEWLGPSPPDNAVQRSRSMCPSRQVRRDGSRERWLTSLDRAGSWSCLPSSGSSIWLSTQASLSCACVKTLQFPIAGCLLYQTNLSLPWLIRHIFGFVTDAKRPRQETSAT
jgi:hypothetical protein